jgi:hypothetical protein
MRTARYREAVGHAGARKRGRVCVVPAACGSCARLAGRHYGADAEPVARRRGRAGPVGGRGHGVDSRLVLSRVPESGPGAPHFLPGLANRGGVSAFPPFSAKYAKKDGARAVPPAWDFRHPEVGLGNGPRSPQFAQEKRDFAPFLSLVRWPVKGYP